MIVLGCGPSGADWNGDGYCIGVNDCFKFGRHPDRLIVINSNFEFERRQIIEATKPKDGLWSHLTYWSRRPDYRPLATQQFRHHYQPGIIYHSKTSPFVALSMAATLGAAEIVMYGVDFDNHPIVKDYVLEEEKNTYLRFIKFLESKNIKVYLGTKSGCFKNSLPIKG